MPAEPETPLDEAENGQRPTATRRPVAGAASLAPVKGAAQPKGEHGGPKGPEPTRYGDWERKGRVSDF